MSRDDKKISIEEIHKEIDLIQSCITRMAQNSFMIKGWFVSIYAVILALLPEKVNMFLLCIALVAVNLIFWYLDGFFLRTEKVYRKIYDWVLEERPQNNRELMYQLNPGKFNGKIENVECIKTQVIDGKAIDMPNTEFEFKADSVVFAIGLKPNKEVLEKERLAYNERGLIDIDEKGKTNIDGVYAGGDLSETKSTVCRALGSAKKAANSIMEILEKGDKNV